VKLRYYHSSQHDPVEDRANRGLEDVPILLGRAGQVGANAEDVDTAKMTEEDRFDYYSRHAVVPSFVNRYAIRQVFGSRRRGGTFFGREIPALIVMANGDKSPIDVYPHQEGGNIVTIRDFLVSFMKEPARYLRLRKIDAGSLSLEKIEKLVQIREEIFGDQVLSGDSAVVIRDARESR
jgi:hypothetical protein